MDLGLSEARHFIECEKRLFEIAGWQKANNRDGRTEKHILEARVAVDGSLPRGLWFRGVVYPKFPNSATFQLDCDRPNARSHHTLYRLEWRPISAHQNQFFGPPEFNGRYFEPGETHEHCCLDHIVESHGRIRSGDIQCARPVNPDFQNFAQALNYVCDKLKIQNRGDIPMPIYQPDML